MLESFPATCSSATAGPHASSGETVVHIAKRAGSDRRGQNDHGHLAKELRAARTPRLANSLLSTDDPERLSCGYNPKMALNWLTLLNRLMSAILPVGETVVLVTSIDEFY